MAESLKEHGKPLNEFFNNSHLSIKDIKEGGWQVYSSSSGSWWWETKDASPRQRQALPTWVEELIQDAYDRGANDVQNEIKRSLGIKTA